MRVSNPQHKNNGFQIRRSSGSSILVDEQIRHSWKYEGFKFFTAGD
jgi:hypothetical protein